MANNPYVNKVVYGNNTLIDLTDATATADKILQGYTAYGADGQKLTGTATGGGGSVTQDQDGFIVLPPNGGSPSGGGLEYEEGTWTPSENSNYPSIPFSNTHSEPPSLVKISDSGTPIQPASTMVATWGYYDAFKLTGGGFPGNSTTTAYTLIEVVYVGTTGSIGSTRQALAHNSSETGSGTSYPSYYASSLGLTPYTLGTRYFLAGRTYKWIAVWAPTT